MGKFDLLGIGKILKETDEQYVNKNMLGNDESFVELPVKHMKLVTDTSGNFVKLIMNWPGYCFDSNWTVVPETPALLRQKQNKLGPNETAGRRYIGLPGINKVVDYPFSWDTFIRVNPDGTWVVKERPAENIKQALCEAMYFMLFNVKTEEGYSINIGVQFSLRIRNGYNVFYGVSTIGRWINRFHSITYSAFNEFALSRNLDLVRKDIAKDDDDSDIKTGLDKMEDELIKYTGHSIDNFDIVGYNWDRKDPMFIALENVATAKQKKLATFEEQEAENKVNEISAAKIKRDKEAEAAGDKDLLLTEQGFIKEISILPNGKEIIEAHYASKMTNLLSYSRGGEKNNVELIKNVDEVKEKEKGKGGNRKKNPPAKT